MIDSNVVDTEITMILVRHGRTDSNAARRIQGHQDTPLNQIGLQQAQELVTGLVNERFDALYCSDLARTRQTLEPYANHCDLPVQYDSQLRERAFGWFEGQTLDEVAVSHPDRATRFTAREPDYDLHGGESLTVFFQRVRNAFQSIAARHSSGEHLLVVAHGGVLDCVQRWARDLPLEKARDYEIPNASINRISVCNNRCRIVSWADVTHLTGNDDRPADLT